MLVYPCFFKDRIINSYFTNLKKKCRGGGGGGGGAGGKVYSPNKGCHTCIFLHYLHVQSVQYSKSLTWLVVWIYLPRSHSLTL